MALGFLPRFSLSQNPPLDNTVDNEPIIDPLGAPTKSSGSPTTTSHALTPGPNFVVTAPVFALAPTVSSTNDKLFKQFMKAYLEAQVQPLTPA